MNESLTHSGLMDILREKYPHADHLLPVQQGFLRRKMIGWTFRVPSKAADVTSVFGWILRDGSYSVSVYPKRREAAKVALVLARSTR